MKLIRKLGVTSEIWQIFIADSSSTTGAGLTGLTNASSSLVAYYHRDTDTTATSIGLVTMTVGTFTSSGFKEIDSANMAGWYQFCPPNAALASGAKSCAFHLKGATNMAPLPIEVQLVAVDVDDTVRLGLTALPNAAASAIGGLPVAVDTSGRVDVLKINGTSQTARDIGASVLLSSGTGTGQLDFTSGVVKANLAQILGTALTETAGLLAGGFKKFFNVASPTLTCLGIDQTGDSYARVGAPAGASVSADVAAVKSDTAAIKAKTDNLPASPAAVGSAMTLTAAYDAAKTAAQAGDSMALTTLHSPNLQSGTAQGGGASTITLASGASSTDNLYRGLEVTIYGGTGSGQTRVISAYVGSTKVASVDEAWTTQPDNTSTYRVVFVRTAKIDSSQQVTAASVQGNVTGSVASVSGNVGGNVVGSVASVTARVTANTDQFAGQTVTAAAGVTLPSSVASPTNITAGVITTVTNLTNAPTSGDFTSTMKTSLNSATPAVTVSDKTGFSLTSAYDPAKTAAQAGDAMALTTGERTSTATAVWVSATRTLTSFGTLVSDIWTAVADSSGVTTLLGRLTGTRATNLDNLDAAISTRTKPADTQAAVTFVATTTNLTNAPGAGDFTAAMKTSLNNATPAVTVSDKTGFSLTSAYDPAKTSAQAGDAMALTSGERNSVADALLKRDWTAVTGEASRSVLNALRFLRNKWSVSGTTLTVMAEDDATPVFTSTISTNASADPIVGSDPN